MASILCKPVRATVFGSHVTARLGASAVGARTFAAAKSWNGGLMNATATDQFYATKLDLTAAAKLVQTPGILWRAAKADVAESGGSETVDAYVNGVEAKANVFFESKKLHDCEVIMDELTKLMYKKGELVIALGGRSLGKTKIMETLAGRLRDEGVHRNQLRRDAANNEAAAVDEDKKGEGRVENAALHRMQGTKMPRRVVVYDARIHGSDLAQGLQLVLMSDKELWPTYRSVLKRMVRATAVTTVVGAVGAASAAAAPVAAVMLPSAAAIAGAAAASASPGAADEGVTPVAASLRAVLQAFIDTCERLHEFPCLVIDEANKAFTTKDKEGMDTTQRTLNVLELLTSHTKAHARMNVILASSEYTEPYRLEALGYRSANFTATVLVPEIPPKEMRALLMDEWGMGPNLAKAFMSVWGGHFWAAKQGISKLATSKAAFRAIGNGVAFPSAAGDGVVTCLAMDKSPPPDLAGRIPDNKRLENMVDWLRELAVRGYVPIDGRNDPRAKAGSINNVCDTVGSHWSSPGIPPKAWQSGPLARNISVVTNQAMRLLLAVELSPFASSKSK